MDIGFFNFHHPMADKLTREQRHLCMSHIRSKNTKPELIVRRFLFANGFRFRVNVKRLPGTPDIVLRKYHTAIFVNGCFWHGHDNCSLYVVPKTNADFWISKIQRNKQRDSASAEKLKKMGWHVIRIWECQLSPQKRHDYLNSLATTLNHLLLVNHGLHTRHYSSNDDEQPPMAAED